MVDTIKFSEMTPADWESGKEAVGLSGGDNALFTVGTQFLPAGTTAERPSPASTGMIRFNTTLVKYEFYNGIDWAQFEDSADVSLLIARLAAHTAGDGASMIGLEDQGTVTGQTVQDLAEADFIVKSVTSSLANAIALSGLSTGFLVNETGTGNLVARSISGTASQIDVANGTGLSANPTLSIAANPTLPGASHVVIPFGTSAQRPAMPSNGYIRYNTDLDDLEFWNNNTSTWEQTASTGALTAIVQDTTPQLGGNLDANGFEINMASNLITNLLDPVSAQDAATKNFVDGRAGFTETIYTASDTWTKPASFTADSFITVWVVAGGGSGGGTGATGAGQVAESGGGGAGAVAYAKIPNASLSASETVTVGVGATAPSAGNSTGTTGNSSAFGAIVTCTGGAGGSGMAATSGTSTALGGNGGSAAGGDINISGGDGGNGRVLSAEVVAANSGGGNPFSGNASSSAGAANNGKLYGGGGTGASRGAGGTARSGGNGANGVVIVREYI